MSVPLVGEGSFSYQPPPLPTSPGHPFDELKDNGWGDIGQLNHIGFVRLGPPPPPQDPQQRVTDPAYREVTKADRPPHTS